MIGSREDLMAEALAQLDVLMSYQRRSFCARPIHRELSLPQLYILITLQESGAMTVSALANLLQISTPSASSIIDRMEEHGLVERTRDQEDRRVVHVALSNRGYCIVDELAGMKREQMQRLLSTMSDSELHDVARGMDALARGLARNSAPLE